MGADVESLLAYHTLMKSLIILGARSDETFDNNTVIILNVSIARYDDTLYTRLCTVNRRTLFALR